MLFFPVNNTATRVRLSPFRITIKPGEPQTIGNGSSHHRDKWTPHAYGRAGAYVGSSISKYCRNGFEDKNATAATIYMYPECRKAESLTPCSGCFFPTSAFCKPFTHHLPFYPMQAAELGHIGPGLIAPPSTPVVRRHVLPAAPTHLFI